jgi:lipopolysaccharide biosynthesis glycosyltransferase
MKKRLIVTIMLGKDPSFEFVKRSFKEYAKKVNADFLCITKPGAILKPNNNNNNNNKLLFDALFQKISLGDLSDNYERVLYLDGDILITPRAKNIFDICNDDSKLYMFNEGVLSSREKELDLISTRLHKTIKDKNYFNTGVILFPKNNNFLKAIRIHDLEYFVLKSNWFDQTYINFKARVNKIPTSSLNREFNRLGKAGDNEKRFESSFIHYAGNGYCQRKNRPIFILNDYCNLYNYSLTVQEKIIFTMQYALQRFNRLKNKLKFF